MAGNPKDALKAFIQLFKKAITVRRTFAKGLITLMRMT